MLYGVLSPRIEKILNSVYFDFDTERTKTSIKYEIKYNDYTAIDGTLHRDFIFNKDGTPVYKIIYTIDFVDVTKDEAIVLEFYDKQYRTFYPHQDNLQRKFKAYIDLNSYYRNNKYFRDWYIIRVELTDKDLV